MVRFMRTFASCFTTGKAHLLGSFSTYRDGLGNSLQNLPRGLYYVECNQNPLPKIKVFGLNFELMPTQPCKLRTSQIVLQRHQLDRLERFRTMLWDFMLYATLFSSSPNKGTLSC
jgi:hypothetical protein